MHFVPQCICSVSFEDKCVNFNFRLLLDLLFLSHLQLSLPYCWFSPFCAFQRQEESLLEMLLPCSRKNLFQYHMKNERAPGSSCSKPELFLLYNFKLCNSSQITYSSFPTKFQVDSTVRKTLKRIFVVAVLK